MTEVSYARHTASLTKGFASLESMQPSELQQRSGMTLVIGGRSNAGKTTLLNTLWDSERIKKVAIADARGRTYVLKDRPGLEVFPIKNWQNWEDWVNAAKTEPNAFDVLVVDTYSEIQAMDLARRGMVKATREDRLAIYNDSHMDMTQTTRELYDISTQYGVHVIFTLWIKPARDQKTGADLTKLMLTNQFEEYFRGIVDYIGLLSLGDAPNPYPPVLDFQPTNTTPQKFSPNVNTTNAERMAQIPRVLYKPSLGHILDTFMGNDFPAQQHKRKTT